MTFLEKLKLIKKYQNEIGSNRTYLYSAYLSETSNNSTSILADTEIEAKYIANILNPNFIYIQIDHWVKGPKIYLK